nr:hypothetical protein GTC16762_04570 [Pigmentibacter ruber]
MEKNKNKFSSVSLNKIHKIYSITNIITIIFSISSIIILMNILFYKLSDDNDKLIYEKNEVIYKFLINTSLSRILILANSETFIDYIRSDKYNKSKLENDVLILLLNNLDFNTKGFDIYDSEFKLLLSIGRKSETYFTLSACYLNDKVNFYLGRCQSSIKVYLNDSYILKMMNELTNNKINFAAENIFNRNYILSKGQNINGLKLIDTKNSGISYDENISCKGCGKKYVFMFSIFVIFMCIIYYVLIKYYFNKLIYRPISSLIDYLEENSSETPVGLKEVELIASKVDFFKNKVIKNEKEKSREVITKYAQIAHDIRSPLVALDIFLRKNSKLVPEEYRVVMRNSLQRIQDIANSLLTKHKEANQIDNFPDEKFSVQLLSSVVESLVSEKRMQYRDYLNISIEENFTEDSYGLFSLIQINEFKRVLSNIINNAIESFLEKKNGKIKISLFSENNENYIIISDNGCGIPEIILHDLLIKNITYNKNNGNGLGLIHAKTVIDRNKGNVSISSNENVGTEVKISFPISHPPKWFISELNIKNISNIVIVDDDSSIHNIWEERFNVYKNSVFTFEIIHFSIPELFIDWLKEKNEIANFLFLIDFEFINSSINGIKLINNLNLYKNSILVTSRFEDKDVIENCLNLNIKILPKNLTYLIPIVSREYEIDKFQRIEAILIDDDEFIHDLWKLELRNNNIDYFYCADDFIKNMNDYNNNIMIFIDSELGKAVKGEEYAKEIYTKGFKNIILCTSYPKEIFNNKFPWIKIIRGKEPPTDFQIFNIS